MGVVKGEVAVKDFFGRVVVDSTNREGFKLVNGEESKIIQPKKEQCPKGQGLLEDKENYGEEKVVVPHKAVFKFNEGFSDAVRKPLFFKDFL